MDPPCARTLCEVFAILPTPNLVKYRHEKLYNDSLLCYLKYPSMEIGELGAHGTVLKPAEVVTSTGGVLVLTQPLRMGVVTVKGPASRSRLRLVMYSGVQVRRKKKKKQFLIEC